MQGGMYISCKIIVHDINTPFQDYLLTDRKLATLNLTCNMA